MVTLQDIADKVGLSRATVSLAINGDPSKVRLNKETCSRIRETAKEMGYYPNEIARSVITGKSNVIGFYALGTQGEFTAKIMTGIMEELEKHNYLLKLLPSVKVDHKDQDNSDTVISRCIQQRLCGVICHLLPEQILEKLHSNLTQHNIPLALVDSSIDHNWGIRVTSDDKSGINQGVQHLIELGHNHFGYISTNLNKGYSILRHHGYKEALNKHNLTYNESACVFTDNFAELEQACLKLFSKPNYPTAILCCSDPVAMITLRAAHKAGLNVPEDISIVGFADLDIAQLSYPPLTTIKQPFVDMGRKVVDLLLKDIKCNKRKSYESQIDYKIPVKLITRGSTSIKMEEK